MSQVSLWEEHHSYKYAELCNALYEREMQFLINSDISSVEQLQRRVKSVPYYVKRTAERMLSSSSPLTLDVQNAMWTCSQSKKLPLSQQAPVDVANWYHSLTQAMGLVVPVLFDEHIVLDSIDRIDSAKNRVRTNKFGWSDLNHLQAGKGMLLKPNKRVMKAACAGHKWLNAKPCSPITPTLRELLLSCSINWSNFKQPLKLSLN